MAGEMAGKMTGEATGEMKGEFRPESDVSPHIATAQAEEVVRLVGEALNLPHPSVADEALLHEVTGLEMLLEEIATLRELALALSRGELDYSTRHRGIVIGALKSMQANLRHLTWQAQRIASGDLDVRVNFLGQFSEAFNRMTAQLKGTLEEKDKLAARYKELSDHDSLTGLYNRTAFLENATRLLTEEAYRERGSAVIMSDIDYFKGINDKYGHHCGDEVLRRVSRLFRDNLRREDLLCRYGGEEFLVLTPGISRDAACKVAQRLCDAVRELRITCGCATVSVTASFGVCAIPPMGENELTESVLREHVQIVDLNLYRAKSTGRDRVVSADCKEREEEVECAGPEE